MGEASWFMLAMLPPNDFLSRTLGPSLVRRSRTWSVALLAFGAACADLHPPPPLGAAGAANNAGAGSTSAGSTQQGGQTGSAAGAAGSRGGSEAISGTGGGPGSTAGASTDGDAGSGGASGPAGEGCGSVTTGDVHAWLHAELPDPKSNELHPFFALTTTGDDIALPSLAIRYYFKAEMQGAWQVGCIWVTQQTAGATALCEDGTTLEIKPLEPPHAEADHYLEVSFAGVSAAEVLSHDQMPPFEARTTFWRMGHPTLDQDNDYSFVATTDTVMTVEGRDYKETTKVTVYRDGELIWGTEPCP
jgi:hypothetical protein